MKQLFPFIKNYHLGFHLENMPNKDPSILRMLTGKMETPGIALASLDRYNKLYPNQEGSDYALYLRGLINFNENQTLFSSITGEDMAERDAEAGRIAFASFKQLVKNFPDTAYREDAIKRMRFLRNVLAENEAHVARFYMRRKAYVASLNRSKVILSQYHGTPATEEALALMVTIYGILGLQDLSNDSLRVLKLNYPLSPYLEYEYDPENEVVCQKVSDEKQIQPGMSSTLLKV